VTRGTGCDRRLEKKNATRITRGIYSGSTGESPAISSDRRARLTPSGANRATGLPDHEAVHDPLGEIEQIVAGVFRATLPHVRVRAGSADSTRGAPPPHLRACSIASLDRWASDRTDGQSIICLSGLDRVGRKDSSEAYRPHIVHLRKGRRGPGTFRPRGREIHAATRPPRRRLSWGRLDCQSAKTATRLPRQKARIVSARS